MKNTIAVDGVNKGIVKRELVFATYCENKANETDDLLMAKEHLFLDDNTVIPNISYYKNFKRKYWVTKQERRDHESKKEYEIFNNLDEYTSTERDLPYNLYKSLHGYYPKSKPRLNDLYKSPYVYGTNPTTPSLLKREYKKKWSDANSPYTLAVMDYEWDVVDGTGEIIAGAVSFKGRLHLAVTKDFLGIDYKLATDKINEMASTYLGEYIEGRGIKPIISICDSSADIIIKLFRSVHEWKPDILGFWNIAGDIDKILESLKKYGIKPEDIFSDPKLPKEYRFFNWVKDKQRRKKSNGDEVSVNFHDLWHKLTCPSSFYCVCLMALYKRVRAAEKNKSKYGLDNILDSELNLNKLKFKGIAEGLTKIDWHKEMQSKFKLEYMIYLMFDVISPELLDEKTKDVAFSFNALSTDSDFKNFPSNPSKLSESIHYGLLDDGIGSLCAVGGSMRAKYDAYVPSLKKWIIALSPELEYKMGNKLCNDFPNLRTNIILHAADIDVSGAYPTNGIILNVSVATRVFEVCSCNELTENERRSIGINLSNIRGNALSIARKTHSYPDIDDILHDFMNDYQEERLAA